MDYSEAIDYLMSLTDMERGYVAQSSPNPTMSLASVRSLLSRLNDPHLGRGTVHVTGSKGKGSTAHMIAGILRRNEEEVALFTSPHLHSFTERIAINGDAISPEEFAVGLEGIQAAVEGELNQIWVSLFYLYDFFHASAFFERSRFFTHLWSLCRWRKILFHLADVDLPDSARKVQATLFDLNWIGIRLPLRHHPHLSHPTVPLPAD